MNNINNKYITKYLEFKLNLPSSTCLQEINQNKLLKEIEKKYNETEKNLNTSMNNQERMGLLKQIDLPKQDDEKNPDLDLKLIVNQNEDNEQIIKKNNENEKCELADFKIEPIKGKESFMLTSLDRNKLVDKNFLKGDDNLENENINNNKESNITSHEMVSKEDKELLEIAKVDIMTKSNESNLLTVKDENKNPNTSIMNSSKLRLKNLMQNVVDSVSSNRSSKVKQADNNKLKLSNCFDLFINNNNDKIYNPIFNDDLIKEINEKNNGETNQLNNISRNQKEAKENLDKVQENKEIRNYESDDTIKNENDREENKYKEDKKEEKTSKIKFKEEKNEIINYQNQDLNDENNNKDNENKSAISERRDTKENHDKIELNLSKVSIKSNKHPVPKKKRSSCQKVIFII